MRQPEAKKDYQPGAAGDAKTLRDGNRWTLVFVREFSHPPSKVWAALTDPANLHEWAPFDVDRDLGSRGTVLLTMVGGPTDETFESQVLHAEAPRLLEYTWAGGVVRWEIEAIDSGSRLTLRHTLDDPIWLPKVAAGWHICLDVAERAIAGRPIGRIVAGEAKQYGWERLNAEYAELFGIENTGWPESMGGAES